MDRMDIYRYIWTTYIYLLWSIIGLHGGLHFVRTSDIHTIYVDGRTTLDLFSLQYFRVREVEFTSRSPGSKPLP